MIRFRHPHCVLPYDSVQTFVTVQKSTARRNRDVFQTSVARPSRGRGQMLEQRRMEQAAGDAASRTSPAPGRSGIGGESSSAHVNGASGRVPDRPERQGPLFMEAFKVLVSFLCFFFRFVAFR